MINIGHQFQVAKIFAPVSAVEARVEINDILDHALKNSLCAFNLQSQLMQIYLMEEISPETVERLLEIALKSCVQVKKMNDSVERLRWLVQSQGNVDGSTRSVL
ncbi:MAG: hypothetical protein ACJ76H_12675 [Bacteriovoracaceae bacterium]